MHNPLPLITEHKDTLKQRLQREHDGRKKPRLQMLYLLASGQAQSRREVAQYGAVAPTTGERFFLELPYLNADTFQLFVDAFAQAFPDSLNLLLLDNRGAHTTERIRWPANVQSVWLPPYCPGLNPSERVWRDVKDNLAWQQFVDLEAQQIYVGNLLQAYDAPTLQALTQYAYLVEAIHALCS
jgi:putative transposase